MTSSSPDAGRDRPQMPAGYGIASEPSEQMAAWSDVVARLTAAHNYWVSTTRPDGRPHVVPVWGLWMDDAFYFSTDPKSRKARNLQTNSAIAVHLESGNDVVILEGQAEQVTDQAVLQQFARLYNEKYQFEPDISNPEFSFYRLRPKLALAWREQDFPTSATRWTF